MFETEDWLTIRPRELESAVRLSAELRDFIPGSDAQRRHFLERSAALVGAPVGIWGEVKLLRHGPPLITHTIDHGLNDASSRSKLSEYLTMQAEAEDPMLGRMRGTVQRGVVVARRRRELLDDKAWYGSIHFNEYRRVVGLDDSIYTAYMGKRGLQGFALHRAIKDRPFSDSERALVRVLHSACSELFDDGAPAVLDRLSPRQCQLLQGIARGLSDKELSAELNLSTHTVHGYLKTLYRRLDVSSRFEAIARYGRLVSRGS
jgi:DNA-binding CsgD family transcriptional regulator